MSLKSTRGERRSIFQKTIDQALIWCKETLIKDSVNMIWLAIKDSLETSAIEGLLIEKSYGTRGELCMAKGREERIGYAAIIDRKPVEFRAALDWASGLLSTPRNGIDTRSQALKVFDLIKENNPRLRI